MRFIQTGVNKLSQQAGIIHEKRRLITEFFLKISPLLYVCKCLKAFQHVTFCYLSHEKRKNLHLRFEIFDTLHWYSFQNPNIFIKKIEKIFTLPFQYSTEILHNILKHDD